MYIPHTCCRTYNGLPSLPHILFNRKAIPSPLLTPNIILVTWRVLKVGQVVTILIVATTDYGWSPCSSTQVASASLGQTETVAVRGTACGGEHVCGDK